MQYRYLRQKNEHRFKKCVIFPKSSSIDHFGKKLKKLGVFLKFHKVCVTICVSSTKINDEKTSVT